MFMSLNLFNAGIEGSGEFSGKYVGAFDDSGRLAGVLVLYWNGILMSQCSKKSLLLQLVADFKKEPFSFQGIFGTTEQVALIKQELLVPVDEIAMDSVEQVFSMSLDSLAIPTASDGMEMVKVGDVNQSLIAEWLLAYSKEALGLDHYDVDRIYSSPECFVLKVSGQPVSLCNFNARLPEVVQVGPVWTPPQYRGCKYAQIIVAMNLERVRRLGVQRAILFTGAHNGAAIRCYEAIGFKAVDFYHVLFLKKTTLIR